MKNILVLSLIFLFISCQKEPVYYEGDFQTIYKLAQKKGKKLWMMVGGGKNCRACHTLFDELEANKVFKKYKKEYLFYKCNALKPSNRFLQYILLMEQIPNSYIFNENGDLVYVSFQYENTQKIEEGLIHVSRGNRFHCRQGQFYIDNQEDLFKMHNYTIKAYMEYVENKNGLPIIDSSIAIYPYFYNLYLKGKMLKTNGEIEKADSIFKVTQHYYKEGYQAIVYNELNNEISTDTTDYTDKPIIEFENEIIKCGTFQPKSQNRINIPFKNRGNKPLVIFYIQSSCGCTKINFSKKPIMPNEESVINIVYDAKDIGDFHRDLTIQSNAKNKLVKLTLSGSVGNKRN